MYDFNCFLARASISGGWRFCIILNDLPWGQFAFWNHHLKLPLLKFVSRTYQFVVISVLLICVFHKLPYGCTKIVAKQSDLFWDKLSKLCHLVKIDIPRAIDWPKHASTQIVGGLYWKWTQLDVGISWKTQLNWQSKIIDATILLAILPLQIIPVTTDLIVPYVIHTYSSLKLLK